MDSKSTSRKCLIGQNQGWRLISYQSVPQPTVEATKVRSMCFGNVDVSAHFWASFLYSKQSFHKSSELLNGVREGDIVERLILIVLVHCFSTWRSMSRNTFSNSVLRANPLFQVTRVNVVNYVDSRAHYRIIYLCLRWSCAQASRKTLQEVEKSRRSAVARRDPCTIASNRFNFQVLLWFHDLSRTNPSPSSKLWPDWSFLQSRQISGLGLGF